MRSLRPAPPPAIRAAADGLAYRDFLVVALILRRDNLFPDNWIYIHTPGVKVGRIQNFNNWSAAMVPEPGVTCLGMEYFCFEGDGLVGELRRRPHRTGGRGAGDAGAGAAIRRRRRQGRARAEGVPDLRRYYRDHLAQIREFLDPIANLHTVGRNGMHKYNNQDHSMLTAMMTVENMLRRGARRLGGEHRLRLPRGAADAARRCRCGSGPCASIRALRRHA